MILCDIGNTTYHFLCDGKSYKKSVYDFEPSSINDEVHFICVNTNIQNKLNSLSNWHDVSLHANWQKYYKTMGIDRVMVCEAVQDGVIVDAGSAITVDVMRNGVYMGGFIYPGIDAMKNCYKSISPKLDCEFDFTIQDKLAKDTKSAISYGYLKLLQKEVMSYNLHIYITGGNSNEIKKLFQNATVDENLVFEGMKKVLHV